MLKQIINLSLCQELPRYRRFYFISRFPFHRNTRIVSNRRLRTLLHLSDRTVASLKPTQRKISGFVRRTSGQTLRRGPPERNLNEEIVSFLLFETERVHEFPVKHRECANKTALRNRGMLNRALFPRPIPARRRNVRIGYRSNRSRDRTHAAAGGSSQQGVVFSLRPLISSNHPNRGNSRPDDAICHAKLAGAQESADR